MRFTKEQRQKIVRDFAVRHNGHFNPRLFLDEVRKEGEGHPAFGWFTWDKDKAAQEYQLWQAREFASGLVVSFSIEEIGRDKSIKVREVTAPFALSAMDGRSKGGGYVVTNPNDPAHMRELCQQAATDLRRWLNRYEAAIAHVGGSPASMRKQLALLEASGNTDANAA